MKICLACSHPMVKSALSTYVCPNCGGIQAKIFLQKNLPQNELVLR